MLEGLSLHTQNPALCIGLSTDHVLEMWLFNGCL